MSIDARLKRLVPNLSARERAVLVLRALKQDTPEDPLWRRTMPPDQVAEFNRLVGLINATNLYLAASIAVLQQLAQKLATQAALLLGLRLWQLHVHYVGLLAQRLLKEPITESEYRRLLEARQQEWRPVGELAAGLVDDYQGRTGPVLSDAAWEHARKQKERELRALAVQGRLAARGRGQGLKLRLGDFHAWRGEPLPLCPDWASAYDLRPDDQAEAVAQGRRQLEELRQALSSPVLRHCAPARPGTQTDEDAPSQLAEGLREAVRQSLLDCWRQLRACELVVEEVAGEFGEDPLRPAARAALQAARGQILDVQAQLARLQLQVELPEEPGEDMLEEFRQLLRRGSGAPVR